MPPPNSTRILGGGPSPPPRGLRQPGAPPPLTPSPPVLFLSLSGRFLAAGGYVLYPQIGDRLDLVCPGAGGAGGGYEYYKLYLVGGAQARRCQVPPAPTLLLTCDRPQRDVRFTIKFQEFSPNLWGHEFRRLHDYYIISESPVRSSKGDGGVGGERGDVTGD